MYKKARYYLTEFAKRIFIGRYFSLIDHLIYSLSGGKNSGWVFGNKIRSGLYGKVKGECRLPLIFIGCFPRSGSTLLRALLQYHPKIAAGQTEINVFQDIKTASRKELMNVPDAFDTSEEELEFIKGKRNLIEIADYILGNFKDRNQADYVLLKQPKHLFFIDKIFKHFPNGKFIHIIRDGRDSTMSQRYYMLPEGRTEWPYDWVCRQWNVFINRGKTYRGNENYLEVKYEELVQKPFDTLEKIFKFLGLESVSENILEEYYKDFDVSKRQDHFEVSQPLTNKNINKWIDKMTDKDKKIFNKIAGKNFIELGYKY
jgi:hypothetical protein